MSAVVSRRSVGTPGVLLDLLADRRARVKSDTAAAMIAQSLVAKRSSIASRICRALSTRTTSIAERHVEREFALAPSRPASPWRPDRLGHFGQRVALSTGGSIRDDAHRVDRLARAPGADQHVLTA